MKEDISFQNIFFGKKIPLHLDSEGNVVWPLDIAYFAKGCRQDADEACEHAELFRLN